MTEPEKLKSIQPNVPLKSAESSSQSFSGPSQSTQSHPSQSTPPSDAPAPTPAKNPLKIKLTTKGGSVPPTPAATVEPVKQKKSKAGRPPKPTAKLLDNRKRPKDEDASDAEGSTIQVLQPTKKLKLNTNTEKVKSVKLSIKTPIAKTPATPAGPGTLKIKPKGKKPDRPRGDGYDSEASDREDDPYIEEQFIFRMVPGDDCDYIDHCIRNRLIGVPKNNGGADIIIKFYEENGRRGSVQVRGNWYASTLVDLPCILEGMKSWDKRGWWKSADICQMLWIFAKVKNESEAKTIALPSIIDPSNYQYPHGITAPMHNCRKVRFRKRLHRDEIEKVEREVQRLLDEDRKSTSSKYTIFDPNARQQSQSYSRDGSTPARYSQAQQYSEDEEEEEEDDNEDAEGEDDEGYFAQNHGQSSNTHVEANFDQQLDVDADGEVDFGDFEADLEAEMEAALEMNNEEIEAATPMSTVAATPSAGDTLLEPREDSGDESVEDDDDDDDEVSEIDEEEKEKLAAIQGAKEDILEMEKTLADQQARLAVTGNPILKKRLDATIRNLKQEIQLKKSSIGEGEGEE
ncbi:TAFII55 protein conserved region-domain-containing protein [Rhexocercosporidium sp. MPI-PUGE-AT-0058]|nr:TAFII55 protein conserved region-domain-containing protein [Rhexocercosporidium sp. MPI-PUGE-AT-0058]